MKGWSVMDCPGLIDLALSYVPLFQLVLLNHPLHLVENPGIERVLLLVKIPLFSWSLVVTSSVIALNDACPKLVGW